jgi:hypothetical protein
VLAARSTFPPRASRCAAAAIIGRASRRGSRHTRRSASDESSGCAGSSAGDRQVVRVEERARLAEGIPAAGREEAALLEREGLGRRRARRGRQDGDARGARAAREAGERARQAELEVLEARRAREREDRAPPAGPDADRGEAPAGAGCVEGEDAVARQRGEGVRVVLGRGDVDDLEVRRGAGEPPRERARVADGGAQPGREIGVAGDDELDPGGSAERTEDRARLRREPVPPVAREVERRGRGREAGEEEDRDGRGCGGSETFRRA